VGNQSLDDEDTFVTPQQEWLRESVYEACCRFEERLAPTSKQLVKVLLTIDDRDKVSVEGIEDFGPVEGIDDFRYDLLRIGQRYPLYSDLNTSVLELNRLMFERYRELRTRLDSWVHGKLSTRCSHCSSVAETPGPIVGFTRGQL
jgi:hypothetical protein